MDGDAQMQSGVKGLLEPVLERLGICGASGFYFQNQIHHRPPAIELHAIFANVSMSANDFLHQARIHVHTANNHHVIAAAENAPFECKVVSAANASLACSRSYEISGAISKEG